MFEICYSSYMKDGRARRVFISNASKLVRSTRGSNIVFSSGCKE